MNKFWPTSAHDEMIDGELGSLESRTVDIVKVLLRKSWFEPTLYLNFVAD